MTFEIVGRDEEATALEAFVDGVGDGPSALVLEGEAGIGKSTLWLAGVERARSQGFRVLSSRPGEAEHKLAYVGLGDLFEDVLADVLPALPPPRRRALEVALLLEEPDEATDPRTLGTAVRDSLLVLAEDRPLLVAIDDVQWLDVSSEQTLAFALRRQQGSPILVLLARRSTEGRSPLEAALGGVRVRTLPVGPLSTGALHRLLHDRLGRPFARQTLLAIHERSGGNPFFALELARVLEADADPAQPLPVPATLEELVRGRISGLPEPTRQALALAAALGPARQSVLEQAGAAPDALAAAFAANVIERESGTIRFTHPLLSSVLYRDLGEERHAIHGRIATIVDDPLVRARHLALSKTEPDAAVAGALDGAVRFATDRGAAAVAAELAEQALRLTPPETGDDHSRRALAAARAHQAAGEWTRARTIASDLLAATPPGPVRAEVLLLLSELESVDRAAALLEEAMHEEPLPPALEATVHLRLAWATRFKDDWHERALAHVDAALELAEELDDDVLRGRARVIRATIGSIVGAPDLAVQAHEFATAVGSEQLVQEATSVFVNTLVWSFRPDVARDLLEREYAEWRDRDEPRSARALWGLAWIEFWAGRWALAAEHAARAHDLRVQYGVEVPQDHLPIALVAVHRGLLELALEHSERALALAEEQLGLHPPQHLAILGLVALGRGDREEAAEWLRKADGQAAALDWGEPGIRWWTGDYVELLLELGRTDEAVRILEAWEADAARLGRDWVLAHVTRSRGLAAAAGGDLEQAVALLERSVAEHERVGDPFGCARALLALGVVRRRGRQKRLARDAIQDAVDAFETIGAAGWAEKARGELGRIGGRQPGGGELTPTERRLAELVAAGRSNKEIAAELFVTPKTVGTTLSRLYAKLGVHSRTELIRRLDESKV
jgi:DNA-binding CsgD family transcriptional regulator